MTDQLSSYRNYAKKIRVLLLFSGLWPARKSHYFTNLLLPLFNLFVSFTMSCFVFTFCREHLNELNLLTKGLGVMGSFLSASLKVACFLINKRNVVDVHYTLEKYFKVSLDNSNVRPIIFKELGILTKSFYGMSGLVFVATTLYFVMPLIIIFVQISHNASRIKFILPYPATFPWSFEGGSFLYWIHYCYGVLAGTFLSCVTSGVDSLFVYYIFQIRAILCLMCHRMKNLSDSDESIDDVVRDCATKYRVILKCCNQLEIIYGPIVLWTFLTSAVICCSIIFEASQVRHWTVGRAIFFMVYITMKLLQALIYAWYGSVITTESEQFREAVYSSCWPGSGNKPFMNNILIMMNHRPISISACKFFVISTDMFSAILNTTISYFFLMQTLDER